EPLMLAFLAEAQLGAGEGDRARATADEAIAVARVRGLALLQIPALLARARVLLATARARAGADVARALDEAAALVEETDARAYTPFIHVERGALARLTSGEAAHQRELREAHRLFTEMGATARAEQVARELGA